jgi:CRISPR-associated protein Cmr3
MAKKPKHHPINYAKQQRKQQRQASVKIDKQSEYQHCEPGTVNLQFTSIDTWFFRESRPHDAAGASELSSLFPPPVRTLMGAVRSFLGDSLGVDWQKFSAGDGFAHTQTGLNLVAAMGNSESLGQLSINGAWVCKNGERLYPAPCYLMQKADEFIRLQIGEVVACDLGKVRLPELPKDNVGYKNVEQTWITHTGWQKLLNGTTPVKVELIQAKDLFENEARLGIARNNQTRSVIEGKLYQTQHVRLENDVTIELDIKGLDNTLVTKLPDETKHEILRLGGEGRMAALEKKSHYLALPTLMIDKQPLKKIIIHFITPAYFGGLMFPENFDKHEVNGQTIWQGQLNDVELIIEAAVIGKTHREGGWDMKEHKPRAVKSYIPAGSAWFCNVKTEISAKDLLEKLHRHCIGEETEWGRGQLLIGVWNDTQTQGK